MELHEQLKNIVERWQDLKPNYSNSSEIFEIIKAEHLSTINALTELYAEIQGHAIKSIDAIINRDPAELDRDGLITSIKDADGNHKTMIDGEKLRDLIIIGISETYSAILPDEFIHEAVDEMTRDNTARDKVYFAPLPEEPAQDQKHSAKKATAEISAYGIMNDKTARVILGAPELIQENGQYKYLWGIEQAPNRRQSVPTYITMAYNEPNSDIDIRSRWNLTAFDHAVCSAIASIYHFNKANLKAGEGLQIAPADIWRAMNGGDYKNIRPTEAQIKRVTESINKLRFTSIRIGVEEELKSGFLKLNGETVKRYEHEEMFIVASWHTIKTKAGKKIDVCELDREPLFYSYNRQKGRILKVSPALLNTSATMSNDTYIIEFRMYLLTQIELMYTNKRQNHKILFNSIYEGASVPAPAERLNVANYSNDKSYKANIRKQAKKDRDKISKLLDAWRGMDYISGYELAPDGVKIKLSKGEQTRRTGARMLAK